MPHSGQPSRGDRGVGRLVAASVDAKG
jgi:hypothetical protein